MKHTKTSFKILSLLLCVFMLLPLCACGEKQVTDDVTAMGADVSITAYGKEAQAGVDAAGAVFTAMDGMLNPESATSTVYAMNNAHGDSVVVPGQVVDMIETAKTVYDRAKGALDLTIYPLIDLWGFDDGSYYKPNDDELELQLEKLCFGEVETQTFADTGTYTVKMPARARISFNAAARGCAADNAVLAMQNAGVKSGIVSMSGCVETMGTKPDGSDWNIAVPDPDNGKDYIGYLTVGETAMSTSALNTQAFTYADGVTYSHIIDPSTGCPVKTDLKSVTVICADGTTADCLSTALLILGRKAALDYWREYGDFQMIMITDSNQIFCTSGLTEAFSLNNSAYSLSYTE